MGTFEALLPWILGSEISLNSKWDGNVSGVFLCHFLLT